MQEVRKVFPTRFPSRSSPKNFPVCSSNHSDDHVKDRGACGIIGARKEICSEILLLYVGQCISRKYYRRNSVRAT